MPSHTTTPQSLALSFLIILSTIYLMSSLWILIRSYGPFRKRSNQTEPTKAIEPSPPRDFLNRPADTISADYTFRCSEPEAERARVMYIRRLGREIFQRMKQRPEVTIFPSAGDDPYESLEIIEDIRRLSVEFLQQSENSKWFKGVRRVFSSQSPEADYGAVPDPQYYVAVNNACYFNTWYRFRCENPNEEAVRVQHLRLLNDRLWLSTPPVDWSNEPYSYDRNWCEDPLDERERIERVRHKVQLELQRERTWTAKLHRVLRFLLVTINPFFYWFWRIPDRQRPLNNNHELSKHHVPKMELHYRVVARPTSPQPDLGRPHALPTTPTSTRNATASRPQALTRSAAAKSKALPKSGPYMETAKIRLIDIRYRYFISTGPHPGPLPIDYDAGLFRKGDLYIHRYTADNMRVWLMDDDGVWCPVKPGHRHPTLDNYFLNVLPDNGKPNWVLHGTWKGVVKRNVVSTKA